MKFDVHHAGMIGGTPIGPFIQSIEAAHHGAAKELAQATHGAHVVVLPHRPTTEKLERALLRMRPASVTKSDRYHRRGGRT